MNSDGLWKDEHLSFIEHVVMKLLLHSLQLYAKTHETNQSHGTLNSFDLKAYNVSALLRKKKDRKKRFGSLFLKDDEVTSTIDLVKMKLFVSRLLNSPFFLGDSDR